MSQTATVSVKDPAKHEDVWVPCPFCDRVTCHKVLAEVEQEDGDIVRRCWESFLTIQCQGCRTVSYCQESADTDYLDPESGTSPLVRRKLYPSRIAGRPAMRGAALLPHGIHRIYKETHTALCDQLPVLAGLGIRAIVEAVCKDKVGDTGDLKNKINRLVDAGLVPVEGATLLHGLRFMGNAAAHEVKAHTERELDDAFDVVEYLLQGGYVLPQMAADPSEPFF